MESYEVVQGKKLRQGYTTGSCAAAATKAAARMLLGRVAVPVVQLTTPRGLVLDLEPEDVHVTANAATCAIRKDSGDDPDITDGVRIYATVEKTACGWELAAGPGVGTVTKDGLACAKGGPAINPVPQRMIRAAAESEAAASGYTGGLKVTISIPGGDVLAAKTFNPRLGIEGGLSILGTSGIVDPMSEKALVDTIKTEMKARRANGDTHLLAFFGNYGVDFGRDTLHLDVERRVTCSNYVGDMLDYAVYCGFTDVLLIGHAGKLIKLALGIMNTHSRYADGRTEFMALQAIFAGASVETAKRIYASRTTDEAIAILKEAQVLEPVMQAATERIEYYMEQRVHGELRCGAILFSNTYGVLGETSHVPELIRAQKEQNT
ncbi:cobalt-precorrin-5B (C(1))-methyltransferase CbiD [uncultured Megasphaera sp.]|jgi:cobalt-precorrin-5B (C1)-methyltransferase|uniref:cobalt-precorrin-5B (C(1))-methyltransferase CbiD n=1 Tax=uncultured Megasphaera sp. TaxID=165188 RepID=UPI002588B0D3|nr:cobalt-precorrin-5B (C(1))-methyltransferase CbiD [uncultured Megasphaera sp.]